MAKALDPESTYGPFMIVLAISWAFWGVLVAQMCTYYNDYASDSKTMKSVVALVWIADTAQKILISCGLYRCVVLNFGRSSGITEVAIMDSEIIPHLAVALTMQGFFYLRIYRLSRSYAVIVIYVITTLAQIVFTVVPSIMTCILGASVAQGCSASADDLTDSASSIVAMTLPGFMVAAFVADALLSGLMTYILYKEYQDASFRRTANLLTRLCYFSVNTGTWTAIFALVTLILYEVDSSSNYYIIFNHSMCSVYSCTLLANLNARNYLRGVGNKSISIKIISFGSNRLQSTTTSKGGDAAEVRPVRQCPPRFILQLYPSVRRDTCPDSFEVPRQKINPFWLKNTQSPLTESRALRHSMSTMAAPGHTMLPLSAACKSFAMPSTRRTAPRSDVICGMKDGSEDKHSLPIILKSMLVSCAHGRSNSFVLGQLHVQDLRRGTAGNASRTMVQLQYHRPSTLALSSSGI
ncbi:hypothetical protein EV121DRAFT_286639 [Schizophyllum commune]